MTTLKGKLRQVELLCLGRMYVSLCLYCPMLRSSKGTSEMTKIRKTLGVYADMFAASCPRTVLGKKSKPAEPSEAEPSSAPSKGSKPKAKAKPKAKENRKKRKGSKTN